MIVYKTFPKLGVGVRVRIKDRTRSNFYEIIDIRWEEAKLDGWGWVSVERLIREDGEPIMPGFYVNHDAMDPANNEEDEDVEY